jgi:hypothetical protein
LTKLSIPPKSFALVAAADLLSTCDDEEPHAAIDPSNATALSTVIVFITIGLLCMFMNDLSFPLWQVCSQLDISPSLEPRMGDVSKIV